jgi:hypothetical protein
MKQYKNTVETIHKTINTSTHITKTPTPTHTHTYTLQNQLKRTTQYKKHTKWNSHNTVKYPQYNVTVMCVVHTL